MKWILEISIEPYLDKLYPSTPKEDAINWFIHDLTWVPQTFTLCSSTEDRPTKEIAEVKLIDFKGVMDE